MIKRNNVIRILTCCLILCFAFGVSLMSMPIAKAQTDAPAQMIMETGASVRLSESEDSDFADATGIRFRLLINQKWYEGLKVMDGETAIYPEIGMYIAIYDQMTEEQIQVEETAANAKFHFVLTDRANLKEVVPAQGENSAILAFNAVIAGIPQADFNTKLIANGYVQPSGGDKQFATNPQIATVAGAASKTIIDNLNYPGEDLDPYGDLVNYVDKVVEQEGFTFTESVINTDMFYSAALSVGANLPENLSAIWKSSNESVATVDASGNITKVGVGTTNITATLGSTTNSCTLNITEPVVIDIDQNNENAIKYAKGNNTNYVDYVPAGSDEIKDFSGGYTGNAVRYRTYNAYTDNYTIDNPYSAAELESIAQTYKSVSLWTAYSLNAGTMRYLGAGTYGSGASTTTLSINFREKAGAAVSNQNTWVKWTVSIEDYIALVAANNYEYFVLFGGVFENGVTAASSGLYVGDVVFEKAPKPLSILTVNSSNWTNYKYANATNSNYIKYAEASSITNITGDYKGNAVYYKAFNAYKDNYTVNNSYTVEQLTKMKETYNTISLWVAFESSIGSISFLNAGTYGSDTLSVNFRQKANVTSATIGVWTKWSVSIDDYISLIEAHGNSKLTLFGGKPATQSVFGIYFGDIFFEYVEN